MPATTTSLRSYPSTFLSIETWSSQRRESVGARSLRGRRRRLRYLTAHRVRCGYRTVDSILPSDFRLSYPSHLFNIRSQISMPKGPGVKRETAPRGTVVRMVSVTGRKPDPLSYSFCCRHHRYMSTASSSSQPEQQPSRFGFQDVLGAATQRIVYAYIQRAGSISLTLPYLEMSHHTILTLTISTSPRLTYFFLIHSEHLTGLASRASRQD